VSAGGRAKEILKGPYWDITGEHDAAERARCAAIIVGRKDVVRAVVMLAAGLVIIGVALVLHPRAASFGAPFLGGGTAGLYRALRQRLSST
jgi:hypothetical protein